MTDNSEEINQVSAEATNSAATANDQNHDVAAHFTVATERPYTQPPALDEFDWDSVDVKRTGYPEAERMRMEQLYESTLGTMQPTEMVVGRVMAITDRDVVLNIGAKSDGMVPLSEFRDLPDLAVGQELEVLVVETEDKNGQLLLSRKSAKMQRSWEGILDAMENDRVIEGKVKTRTKGGLVVDVDGIETFLPGSQIDVKPVRDYDQYVGKTMEFKVVKVNMVLKNAVVSHKILIESDLEAQKLEIVAKLEKGQVLEGVVKNMTDFGVFVDLGGVDGLLHITDISWGRISHPSEALELDQQLNVVVLDFDDEKKRISLGLKQLTAHPWDSLTADLEPGSRVSGKVSSVADYGAFLEVTPGVEGLIHVSEMSWSQHLRNPTDFFKIGDEVEAVVLNIDRTERKLSLGTKQLTNDPWTEIAEKFPVGSRHTGVVRNLTNFGLFVELGEGVDGLVHVSDLSWTKKINHPSEFTKKDEKIDVVVLEIDLENRRLSLGHKQLEDNPWDTFETIFFEGSAHEGTITALEDKYAVVSMPYGLEASCPRKQLRKADGAELAVNEVAQFIVIEFAKDTRRITVSHTRTWQAPKAAPAAPAAEASEDETRKQLKKMSTSKKDAGTMGEMDALAALKNRMQAGERAAQAVAISEMDSKIAGSANDAEEVEETEEVATTEAHTEIENTANVADTSNEELDFGDAPDLDADPSAEKE